jgi:hypothetical protein
MMRCNHGGQQLIEYLLLSAVVIVVLIIFARPNGPFHQAVDTSLNSALEEIRYEAQNL